MCALKPEKLRPLSVNYEMPEEPHERGECSRSEKWEICGFWNLFQAHKLQRRLHVSLICPSSGD